MALLMLLLVFMSHGAEEHDMMMMSIRKGMPRVAVRNISRRLENQPDDAEFLVLLGIAWERAGLYADSMGVFQLVASGEYYEQHGIDSHANTLRELGQPSKAIVLREERLLDAQLSEGRHVRTLLAIIDDCLMVGDLDKARETAFRALSIYPKSPKVHAVLAQVYLANGDQDEAQYHLFTSLYNGMTAQGAVMGAMMSIEQGDFDLADRYLEEAKILKAPTDELTAWRAEVARLMGDLDKARALLQQNRWMWSDDPWMMAVRIRVAVDMGDEKWANETVERGQTLYSHNPEMKRSIAYFYASGLAY